MKDYERVPSLENPTKYNQLLLIFTGNEYLWFLTCKSELIYRGKFDNFRILFIFCLTWKKKISCIYHARFCGLKGKWEKVSHTKESFFCYTLVAGVFDLSFSEVLNMLRMAPWHESWQLFVCYSECQYWIPKSEIRRYVYYFAASMVLRQVLDGSCGENEWR